MKGLVRFARNQLGIELYPGQREVLESWIAADKRKLLMACGRRGGKTTLAAICALYNGTVEQYEMPIPGSTRYIIAVSINLARAREFIKACRTILRQAPDQDLASLVDESSTLDEIVFMGGEVIIRALPCSSRAARGDAVSMVVMDELASFVTTEDGFQAGRQVYESLMPSLAQFGPRGRAMFLSSPLFSSGIFWDLYQAGMTGSAPDLHVVQRPTWTLNPHITRESLAFEEQSDPDYFRREYEAQFIEGSGAFLSATAINACVQRGRKELPPVEGIDHVAACDPAFTGDSFALCVGHRAGTGDQSYVIDYVTSWRGRNAPLDSDRVLDDIAEVCRRYSISEITSDQYSIVPLSDAMRRRGIVMRGEPWTNKTKMDAFTALRRAINTEQLELLDHPQLISELITLETRPTPSGLARIQASGSHHDDHACALASVVFALSAQSPSSKWYGSRGANAEDWIQYYAQLADDAHRDAPPVTVREVHGSQDAGR